MSDPLIKDEIYCVLLDGPVTVDTYGQFRTYMNIAGSSKAVKRALGSMIRDGDVRRIRPQPEGCTSGHQPITFRLA